jgi:hypothetical protein
MELALEVGHNDRRNASVLAARHRPLLALVRSACRGSTRILPPHNKKRRLEAALFLHEPGANRARV